MDKLKIKHFVITRFANSPRRNHTLETLLDENRLQNRLELFKYTVKSLCEQTNQNFEHVVITHKELPQSILTQLKSLNVRVEYDFNFYKRDDLSEYQFLITTRIDDDDALYNGAIQDIQTCFNKDVKIKIFGYQNGCTYHTDLDKYYSFDKKYKIGMLAIGLSLIVNLKYFRDNPLLVYGRNHTKIKNKLREYLEKNYVDLKIDYTSINFWEQRKTNFPAFIYRMHSENTSLHRENYTPKKYINNKEIVGIKNFPIM